MRLTSIQKILDVIPANMPGMDYVTRSPVYDYKVIFFPCFFLVLV